VCVYVLISSGFDAVIVFCRCYCGIKCLQLSLQGKQISDLCINTRNSYTNCKEHFCEYKYDTIKSFNAWYYWALTMRISTSKI